MRTRIGIGAIVVGGLLFVVSSVSVSADIRVLSEQEQKAVQGGFLWPVFCHKCGGTKNCLQCTRVLGGSVECTNQVLGCDGWHLTETCNWPTILCTSCKQYATYDCTGDVISTANADGEYCD